LYHLSVMAIKLDDVDFWSDYSDYQKLAHRFTSFYGAQAWAHAAVPAGARVLDIAAGTGALALEAAKTGGPVLATDFSPGMIEAVLSHGLPNLEGRVMDGQALDLPDGAFDAAFSMFGIMLFPDWRAGLAEMARVVRPGGSGTIGTWAEPEGAASTLLLGKLIEALFPGAGQDARPEGLAMLSDAGRLVEAMVQVGFRDIRVTRVSSDFPVDIAMLAEPDRLFQFSPYWSGLGDAERGVVVAAIRGAIEARGGALPVPSPALIATGVRAG
jgi:ubiquinone/menaquinone biosynthesis C-methylase UbiE